MKKDTIPAPPVSPAPNLPPGVIRVKGQIIEVHPSKDSRGGTFKLKVAEFLGMGSSAPAVTAGDTMTIEALKLPEGVKKDSLFIMELKYRHILAKFQDTTSSWLLVKSGKRTIKDEK